MRAEQNSRVKQIAQERAPKEGQRGDIALDEPAQTMGVERATVPPLKKISNEIELNTACESNSSDQHKILSSPQKDAPEQYINQKTAINYESGPRVS
jgi:hypothetical protein